MTNAQIARRLRDHATELSRRGDNLYRIRAFRQAAIVIQQLDCDVDTLLKQRGIAGLRAIPGIGQGLATTITHYLDEIHEPLAVGGCTSPGQHAC